MKKFAVIAVFLLFPCASHADGSAAENIQPSFDCTKARSPSEKLVCSNSSLAERDKVLANLYEKLIQLPYVNLEMSDKTALLKQGQRNWLKSRDSHCSSAISECQTFYDKRIADLKGYSENPSSMPLTSISVHQVASPHFLRAHHVAVLMADGRVIIAGGRMTSDLGAPPLKSVEIYDPKTDSWAQAADLAQPRADAGAVLLKDGRILLAGGGASFGSFTQTVEIYDPKKNVWSFAAELAGNCSFNEYLDFSAYPIVLNDGRVFSKGSIYDPTKNEWSNLGNPGLHRAALSRLPGDRILYAGSSGPGSNVNIFNPANNSWVPGKNLNEARGDAHAILLKSGKIIILGGRCFYGAHGGDCLVNTVEAYDPAKDVWTKVGIFDPSMCEPEYVFEVRKNRILSIDWCGEHARLYNVDTGKDELIGGFQISRDFTATQLNDGSILIISPEKAIRIAEDSDSGGGI